MNVEPRIVEEPAEGRASASFYLDVGDVGEECIFRDGEIERRRPLTNMPDLSYAGL
jgi:hypothetical protein